MVRRNASGLTQWPHDQVRRLLMVVLLTVAIGLTGCGTLLKAESAQVPRIVLSSLSDPETFNPYTGTSSSDVEGLIFDGLLTTNGVTGELEPGMAESWKISDDQLSIIFTLRDGLKWSDGAPLTVDDVLFTFNDLIFNPKIPSSSQDIFRIGETGAFPQVTKVGDRQIEFRSPEPFAPLLRFAGGARILPKHVLQASVEKTGGDGNPQFLSTYQTDTPVEKIISSGPYQLFRYSPNQRLIVQRNPNYWAKDDLGNPQPYIEQMVFEIVESTDNALMQFRSGGLDVQAVSPDYFSLIKREEERGNFTIYEGGPTLSTSFLTFNLNTGSRQGKPLVDPIKSRWFNSLNFRQAIAHAIDRQTMINNIYQGLGVPQNSPIYIQSPYYLPPERGLPAYDYDPEKSKTLLKEAGFTSNAGGQLLDADGNRVRFTLITNSGNKIREALGSQVKRDLAAIGIQVDFQPLAFNTLIERMSNTLDWDSIILGISGAGIEPDGGRNTWSPSGRLHLFNQLPDASQEPLEGRVVSDWENQIYSLFVQGGQELDDEKRKVIYGEVQKLAQANLPFIYLVNPLALSAVRDRISGVEYSALGGALWNINELKLTEE